MDHRNRLRVIVALMPLMPLMAALAPAPAAGDASGNIPTEEWCGAEMEEQRQDFLREMKKISSTEIGKPQYEKKLTAWLKARHEEVVEHENDHKRVAGKWGDKARFVYYSFNAGRYAMGGCVPFSTDIPLNVMVEAALAPKRPSRVDREVAARGKTYIQIKAQREACKKLYDGKDRASCLKPYRAYEWLDKRRLD